ncbi:MAG: FAD-dependent oxidoreductase [Anaerolineales bacterium]|jgi:heterodisulfide reductase subunit A
MDGNSKPAALVIGAGIAGMQASLDIGNAGYPVYLVEKELGIGGRMAQLDKTFPTLDCASCIITPKLADVGRHPLIDLVTYSEVVKVEGEPGAFRVTVRHKPRYVDTTRCVGCGLCSEACPVPVPDDFNMRLDDRKAIYRLFAQVVPNIFGIDRTGRAPCRDACPAGQRVPGYLSLVREGRYEDAMRTIKLDNPFPGICGRICPHPCETACNRELLDASLNIKGIKRFVADYVYAQERQPIEAVEPVYEERIAIVGAGPAGLTAAQDLTLAGYAVTVFETLPKAGGMLRVGVPEYRLPDDIIDREIQDILDLGVELKLNTKIDDVQTLLDDGFAAVLVAVGAHDGIRLPIEGNDLDGVLLNTDFLREVRLGQFEKRDLGRVLVLGGGNVAVDCARTAARIGAKSVAMACLESADQMPAHSWEIDGAREEGVEFHNDRTFVRLLGKGGRVSGVECERAASFSFDEAGRLALEVVPDSKHVIEADTVIFSVRQNPDLGLCGEVELTSKKTLAVDPETLMTSREGIFAAGDDVTGTAFAIDAIADGHRAARSIHQFLRKKTPAEDIEARLVEGWRRLTEIELPIVKNTVEELAHLTPQARMDQVELTLEQVEKPFAELEQPLTEKQARAEAARCLNCGVCAECMQCLGACEANAIDHSQVVQDEELEVGTIVVATGYDPYDPSLKPNLGYGKYPNVISALESERLFSASGPTMGELILKDGRNPEEIVFIQCVGSRDLQPEGNPYCSRVCCMYSAKLAHLARERHHDAKITVFYIDIRAFGKGFEEFHERVRGENITYRRGNVSEVVRGPNGKLLVRAEDTLLAKPVELDADLVILSTALVPRKGTVELAKILGLKIGEDGFFEEADAKLDPCATGVPGIFMGGACQGPKDILDSVGQAKGAASAALVVLAKHDPTLKHLKAAAD